MWIADRWKDYEVIDTSNGEKLERWGDYILVRPDPQVIWNTPHKEPRWKQKNGHYHRSNRGGGEWEFFDLPKTGKTDQGIKFICLYRWSNACSSGSRSFCDTCGCVQRNGCLG